MKEKHTYLYWGLTAFAVICGVIVFYDTVFRNSVLMLFLDKLMSILAPVCYGCAMAYVLAPLVNWFERLLDPAVIGNAGQFFLEKRLGFFPDFDVIHIVLRMSVIYRRCFGAMKTPSACL